MNNAAHTVNEEAAATAFSKQAPLFDALYSPDTIIQYKRKRVRDHILQWLQPGSHILELNAGTGEDAVFFAQKGHTVHATDISDEMQKLLMEKARQQGLQNNITTELRSYTDLENLSFKGPYDFIFSNFAGLNCTNELSGVLRSFDSLLKQGGIVTMVILPKFCLWEFLLLFKGKFKTGFRRFSGRKGTKAHIEGEYFPCWYYNPSFIQKHLKNSFDMIGLEGLCTIAPPSYLQGFAEKYPKTYEWLIKKENKWKAKWPWKTIGDYYITTLRKKGGH
ncbi:MAG: methyltransferase domain-containing protein [Chitinophagaceae bacterium]